MIEHIKKIWEFRWGKILVESKTMTCSDFGLTAKTIERQGLIEWIVIKTDFLKKGLQLFKCYKMTTVHKRKVMVVTFKWTDYNWWHLYIMSRVIVTIGGYWIDNWVYWITVYTLQFNTVHCTTVFPLGRVSSRLGPGPPADPAILRRLNYSTPSASLSEIYNLWTDCREDTAFGIVGCLAITRKRLPSGLHVTKERLLHGVHVTIK
jgi:hypothetical protein